MVETRGLRRPTWLAQMRDRQGGHRLGVAVNDRTLSFRRTSACPSMTPFQRKTSSSSRAVL
jgi:hypothetical protein